MSGITNKPPAMCSRAFAALFGQLSKAALIDTLWCACQLGTDESAPQIATQAARNAVIALEHRQDRIPADVRSQSTNRLNSDPPDDETVLP